MSRPSSVLVHHALAAYAEPLVVRRRVAVFRGEAGEGDERESIADRLLDLGARDVRTFTPDDDLGPLPAASFDLALLTDLGAFEAPAQALAQLRRLVGEAGVALIVAANRDVEPPAGHSGGRAFDYYELFDMVAREFADVKMVAQVPFHGVVLAELGLDDESTAVSVDTQLVEEPSPPQAYVALASQRGVSLEAYAIFQLPSPPPTFDTTASHREAAGIMQADLARETLRADALATQIDLLRPQVSRANELARELPALRSQVGRVVELEREVLVLRSQVGRAAELEREVHALRSQAARAAELEREVHALRSQAARAAELEREVASLRTQVARVVELEREVLARGRALAELSSEVEASRAAASAGLVAAGQVEELARRADRAERALARVGPELEGLVEAHAAELQRFEATLRDRAAAVRSLEVEVARRERMVHELLSALEEHGDAVHVKVDSRTDGEAHTSILSPAMLEESARLRERLDAMALDLARREGDAQATAWKVAELERQLATAPSTAAAASPAGPSDRTPTSSATRSPELVAALDEIDALRRALTQEHEQRMRAEVLLKRPSGAAPEPTEPTL